MSYIIVQTTCSSNEEAKHIASVLLEEKLAACIQISEVNSYYIWHGEVCEDTEKLLSIKTKKSNFKKIKSKIKENHSYDLPEIIEIPITNGSNKYLNWIGESC